MTCPVCGAYAPADRDTGYDANDICPSCAADGWVLTYDGQIVNEYDDEQQLRGTELDL